MAKLEWVGRKRIQNSGARIQDEVRDLARFYRSASRIGPIQ
jgi:hypothetical protein